MRSVPFFQAESRAVSPRHEPMSDVAPSDASAASACTPCAPLPEERLFCRVIPGFLTRAECTRLIAESEVRGFAPAGTDYPPSYRDNDRQVLDAPSLAHDLLPRLRAVVPLELDDADVSDTPVASRRWHFDALNDRFRLCRYRAGQSFGIHRDGVHHDGAERRSCLTFMVYLTDGDAFEGGDTVFVDSGPGGAARVTARIRPRAGSLIVFDHRLWHRGERVRSGVKHVLRSDVMYRTPAAPPADAAAPFEPAHRGYVWTMAALDATSFASAGRDKSIRIWRTDGTSQRVLEGHGRSVLGLARLSSRRLASVSRDRGLRVWDWREGRCLRVREQAHEGAILAVVALAAQVRDEWNEACGSNDATDADDANGASLAGGAVDRPGSTSTPALATAGADARVRLWTHDLAPVRSLPGHRGWIWALASAADGLLASASEDGDVRLWDVAAGRCLHVLPGATPLRALAVRHAGRCLVAGGLDGRIAVWHASDAGWRVARVFRAHDGAVRRLRVLSDGLLASVGEDGAVRCWNLEDAATSAHRGHDIGHHADFATDVLEMPAMMLSCGYDGRLRPLAAIDRPPATDSPLNNR